MLHFRKMTLRDFGPYKGEQTIDFTDKSGVTIFWGNNGRGKTTLLNAFRYALFGVIQRRNGVLKSLSEMSNTEAMAEGRYGFSVVLDMTNDNDTYRLTRELALREGVTKPSGEEDYEKILSLNKNGSILSPEGREHELNMIMPEQVARFFLFDAELLQEYEELLETNTSEGDHIKTSIEKILGVPVLQNGVVDIEECLSKYEKQKSRAARDDGKTTQLGQEMDTLTANIDEHQNIIREKQSEQSELIRKKNALEGRMHDTEKLRNWIVERDKAEKNKKKAEDELEEVKANIRELMRGAWRGMLLNTVRGICESIEKKASVLESKRQRKTVAEKFIIEMKKAISDRVCPVCGQDVSDDIIQHLRERIKESTNEYAGLSEAERQSLFEFQAQIGALKRLSEGTEDARFKVAAIEERIDSLELNIGQYKQEIEELRENIERYGEDAEESDVLSISKAYSDVEQTLREVRRGIENETTKLNALKANKEKVAATIDKMAGGDDYRAASRRYELCEHVYKIFEKSKALYRERLKQNVEKDATELFVKLTGDKDYVGLKINDNYGLEIIHRSGRKVPGRSSGYEHVVALSLIGALHMNAPLRGPIIMDSPFGRLDPTHKANIARTLSSMAEQSMLLAYTGEIDDQVARYEIGNKLVHEYQLERVSSMHTEIK
ncbi:hypothetical protein NZ47_07010 [Anaerovibrio lipolyticus]|uniref:Nuclease SbcCD subunit C n=1 Tax=Anaerovibrio lipolyticus TaxID=82374 RepID=A0A0B2JZ98_9FIRM|nr:AAA family ATPase [Anaerovibrio lipolyticus]KHM52068.1 hypothetical protein NZ47_07010 [Anaerovibrio lipolyticus]